MPQSRPIIAHARSAYLDPRGRIKPLVRQLQAPGFVSNVRKVASVSILPTRGEREKGESCFDSR